MAKKTCGVCQFYQGPKQKCGAGKGPFVANATAPSFCFKGPASLFDKKVCGGCRFYQGPKQKCDSGKGPFDSIVSAPSACYSPIPG
jgi:hypothetical protein